MRIAIMILCGALAPCVGCDHDPPAVTSSTSVPENAPPVEVVSPSTSTPSFVNSLGIDMIWIPGGSFEMGLDNDHFRGVKPPHAVELDGFYFASTEVTKGQFRQFVDDTGRGKQYVVSPDPEALKTRTPEWGRYVDAPNDHYPAIRLSWHIAVAFAEWLSDKEGRNYRLPTEAEWEYAARAGTTGQWYWWGDRWQDGYTAPGVNGFGAHPFPSYAVPKTYPSNPWGIYEVLGNVPEWVSDWYDEEYYANSPKMNPNGPESGELKVLRGGGVDSFDPAWGNSVVARLPKAPNSNVGGIRLVCTRLEAEVSQPKSSVLPDTQAIEEPLPARTIVLPGEVSLSLVRVPRGTVRVGSFSDNVVKGIDRLGWNEGPFTEFSVDEMFVGTHEITQKQFRAVMSENPSVFTGSQGFPVDSVTWAEAKDFCRRLTEIAREASAIPADQTFRLPFEHEWEYFARAGTVSGLVEFENAGALAWHVDAIEGTREVGLGQPNSWGLYDVHGNVAEWCGNRFFRYPGGKVTAFDALRGAYQFHREDGSIEYASILGPVMVRGGAWNLGAHRSRVPARQATSPRSDVRYNFIGFRVVQAKVK